MNHPARPDGTPPTEVAHLRKEALAWFVRRNNEAFGGQEEQAYQAWLQADPARQAAMAHWQVEWQAFDAIPLETRYRLQSQLAIGKAQRSARQHPPATSPNPQALPERPQTLRRALLPALAAMVTITVTAAAGMMAWNHWQAQPLYVQSFSTPQGQQADLTLPDGSRLRLDASTQLRVAFYRQYREVQLNDGQAVFSVQTDATRPFHVNAGPLRVTVVGTRFMVRHTPHMPYDAGVQVAVEEGRVRVERADRSGPGSPVGSAATPGLGHLDAMVLEGGQQVSSDTLGTLAAVTALPPAAFALWREHRVRFDNTRLDQALEELARYRDPQLVVRDPAVAALRVTGVFDPRDPATFRRVLPLSLPVKLKPGGEEAEVVLAR
jgi:transmembrane sensor